jgi:hypothetical protein
MSPLPKFKLPPNTLGDFYLPIIKAKEEKKSFMKVKDWILYRQSVKPIYAKAMDVSD